MAAAAAPTTSASTNTSVPPPSVEVGDLTAEELNAQIKDIQKSVAEKETRLTSRALRRFFTTTRKRVTAAALANVVALHVPELEPHDATRKLLFSYIHKLPTPMEAERHPQPTSQVLLPEVEIYLRLLVTVALLDNKLGEEATASSATMIARLQTENRRTLNPLAAKAFFYYSRSFELVGRLAEIRPVLLAAHRTSSLHHDDETHATILNLLLRNYLHYNLYDQADKLQSKSSLKEDATSSNQLARFRYYQGRIKGIQLDYTGAYTDLQEAIRKAPQHSARGFRQTVHKFACIVQLLMGEIPERAIFRQTGLRQALKPYLQLTQAVRVGDLAAFHDVLKQFGDVFKADKTYTLIQRLRRNVIKTGLRKINVSYSRISLADICQKLHLDSVEDAEFIVAKAIRDGVIDATVDHQAGYLRSKENIDVYSTQEPLEAFNMRTNFCLKMHNEAVKGMRYPPDMPKPSLFLESEEQKEKLKQEKEFLEKSASEDDDDEI